MVYVVCGYIIHNWSLNICTYNVGSFLVVYCLLSGLRPYVVCGYIYPQLVCRYIHMMWVHFWWYMVCGYIIHNWSLNICTYDMGSFLVVYVSYLV